MGGGQEVTLSALKMISEKDRKSSLICLWIPTVLLAPQLLLSVPADATPVFFPGAEHWSSSLFSLPFLAGLGHTPLKLSISNVAGLVSSRMTPDHSQQFSYLSTPQRHFDQNE